MTTRGGSRRDLFRAIEERDRIIADLRAELASMRGPCVTVRCVKCGATRQIAPGELGADEFPVCAEDYSPMMPVRAEAVTS